LLQHLKVIVFRFDRPYSFDPVLFYFNLLEDFLCLLRIIPEIVGAGDFFQLAYFLLSSIQVKDNLEADRSFPCKLSSHNQLKLPSIAP